MATSTGAIGDTVVAIADELDAGLVVIGSRGRRGLATLVLGSVSHHVSHHVRRPLLVIPSPRLATARKQAAKNAAEALAVGGETPTAA